MENLNPNAEMFTPTHLKPSVDHKPLSYTLYNLYPQIYLHRLPLIPSCPYAYPPLPATYYKTCSAPPTPVTYSFPSCAAIPVFSTSTTTCSPPTVSTHYCKSSLGPEWYESINPYPSLCQPFSHTSRVDQTFDHQSYGLTSIAAKEMETVHEEEVKNPQKADDIYVQGGLKGKKKKMNKPPRLIRRFHHRRHQQDMNQNTQKKMIWVPKSKISSENGVITISDHDRVMDMLLPSKKIVDEKSDHVETESKKTTLMIRNIPSKYTKMLVNLLEDHCIAVNQNGATDYGEEKKEKDDNTLSAFDFIYLPIDFETGCNRGYAFVNMVNSFAANKLRTFLDNYEWKVYQSKKICKITDGNIQGKEALIKHFENIWFPCETDTFLPLCFNPYCDGAGGPVEESTVGKLCAPIYN